MNLDYYRPAGAPSHGDDRIRLAGTEGVLEVSGGKVTLITAEETQVWEPKEAPELLEEFLAGGGIEAQEIFYLTKVALVAKEGGTI